MSGTPRTYAGADSAAGPLLTVSHAHRAVLGEWVRIAAPGQPARRGQVIDVSRGATVVQVFEDTVGLAPAGTAVTTSQRSAAVPRSSPGQPGPPPALGEFIPELAQDSPPGRAGPPVRRIQPYRPDRTFQQ